MKTCSYCKHWGVEHDDTCNRINRNSWLGGAGAFLEGANHGEGACLMTTPDFGCTAHEEARVVHSSHGDIIIDDDGEVVRVIGDPDGELKDIVRFDLAEYRKTYSTEPDPRSYDILDLGFWFLDEHGNEVHQEPDLYWREEVKP